MTIFNVQIDLKPCYICGAYVDAEKLQGHEANHINLNNRLARTVDSLETFAQKVNAIEDKLDALFKALDEAQKQIDNAEREAIVTEPSGAAGISLPSTANSGIPLKELADLASDDVPF